MLVDVAREKSVALEEKYERKRARDDRKKGKEDQKKQKKYQRKEQLRVQKTATKIKKQSTSGKGKKETQLQRDTRKHHRKAPNKRPCVCPVQWNTVKCSDDGWIQCTSTVGPTVNV